MPTTRSLSIGDRSFPVPAKLVANLPYNIATPLLIGWLGDPWPPWYESMTLMFQKEVADRIIAAPGTGAYGRLSVICQWRCKVSKLFDITSKRFHTAAESHVLRRSIPPALAMRTRLPDGDA